MGYGYGMWGMWGGFGMLLGLVFWLAVIGLVVFGLRALMTAQDRGAHEDALEIVRRRFARGEISPAEFEVARRALTEDREPR
ncbi:MAG: SHOCT domain-containing protein [Chloroflexi bacterium]|nr:SHOCT domain-containing protein [Chloroflexota bacterium]